MSSILRNVRTIEICHEKSLMKDLARFTLLTIRHVCYSRVLSHFWHSHPQDHLYFLVGGALARGQEGY